MKSGGSLRGAPLPLEFIGDDEFQDIEKAMTACNATASTSSMNDSPCLSSFSPFPRSTNMCSLTKDSISLCSLPSEFLEEDDLRAIEEAMAACETKNSSASGINNSFCSSSCPTNLSSLTMDLPGSISFQSPSKKRKVKNSESMGVRNTNDKSLTRVGEPFFSVLPARCSLLETIRVPLKRKLPCIEFKGKVVYSATVEEIEAATKELEEELENKETHKNLEDKQWGGKFLGFDLEWEVSFQRGSLPRLAAVLQLCANAKCCHVMHIFHTGIPPRLLCLLQNASVGKVGVGSTNDSHKLRRDYGVNMEGVIDLATMANQKLRTPRSGKWSLSGLAEELLDYEVAKPGNLRLGLWENRPLSEQKMLYAATDAYVSLRLYQILLALPQINQPEMVEVPPQDKNDGGAT